MNAWSGSCRVEWAHAGVDESCGVGVGYVGVGWVMHGGVGHAG